MFRLNRFLIICLFFITITVYSNDSNSIDSDCNDNIGSKKVLKSQKEQKDVYKNLLIRAEQEQIVRQEVVIDCQNKELALLREKIKELEMRDSNITQSVEQKQQLYDPTAQLAQMCLSKIEDTFDQELINEIMNNVPERLRSIIALMSYREDPNDLYCGGIIPHHLLLVGPPGVGKTTFAKAIACCCRMPYTFIKASVLANEYINSGPTNLYRIFTPILNSTQPELVIIDELQTIMKNNKQVNEAIAEALWMILDECRTKNNILIER